MPAGPLHLTRRTALAIGAAGLVAVTGCDGRADPAPADLSAIADADSDADPDAVLVDEVLAAVASITGLVAGVGARHPRLADPMTDLRRMHDAHTEALDATPVTGPGTARVPADPAAALVRVRREEQALQRRLVEAAVAAESGPLARLLASMSAAVAQRLTVVPGGAS